MNVYLSMATFALASSISPGPVNIVAVGCGAQFGWRASAGFVTGATAGFTLLLLLLGMGLHELLERMPGLDRGILWAGVGFLLYMAGKLALDNGQLSAGQARSRPSLRQGAIMQWLNPKAWLASLAGMGAYAATGEATRVAVFALIYFVVCYLSIACWAFAGTFLRVHLRRPAAVRWFNRTLALLLIGCAFYLLLE